MGAKATVAAMVVERMASFIMFDSGVICMCYVVVDGVEKI